MGWKTFKEHFGITHNVHIVGDKLYIGSPYISMLVAYDLVTGLVQKSRTFPDFVLDNYPNLEKASPNIIKDLLAQEDSFGDSITVYSFKDNKIVEQFCEKPGWPNVTNDGELMYENSHYVERPDAVAKGISDLTTLIQLRNERIVAIENELLSLRENIRKESQVLEMLRSE